MSRSELIRWECCDQTFEVLIWQSINRDLSPGKTEEFALGKLNKIVCPKCGFSMLSPWPVLFNDMEKKIMVRAGGDVRDEADTDAEDREETLNASIRNGLRHGGGGESNRSRPSSGCARYFRTSLRDQGAPSVAQGMRRQRRSL